MIKDDITGKMEIAVIHVTDGKIITRNVSSVPRIGDWISLGMDVYVVKKVIWNFSDARSVKLLVEEPKD
jgi:hypothetical protein